MEVTVLSPERPVSSLTCRSVTAPGKEGYFSVLPEHAAYISEVAAGELILEKEGGEMLRYFLSGGYVNVDYSNKVTVLATVIESQDDIDAERASGAEKRAQQRLLSKGADVDFVRAQAALKRAQCRISISRK
tara:strand:- start:2482 stop:2877 length:396 start_codon:yes stop_codon:yes gene_type:complete